MEKQFRILVLSIIYLSVPGFVIAETEALKSAVETKIKTQDDNIKSQKVIENLAEETRDIVQEYRTTIRKTDSLKSYNQQLSKLVKKQKDSLDKIRRQLDNVEETQRSIVPLMIKMINTLDKFVNLDMPFLISERKERVKLLHQIMDSPDVTLPDKYRRIMEAYQIEMEYGRTIESYTDTIKIDGHENTVDILRVGRLLMTYQTLDGKESGVWDRENKKWTTLPGEYDRSIKQGIQVAKKQAPPELIKLPINPTGK